jgi:ubiquinone/menaquinone biosynthesis C-methylase UbiE
MTTPNTSFTGMDPAAYHTGLGPMFFEPYAADLARRLTAGSQASILETAAGTGIVTRNLLRVLPSDARLLATDLNENMLALARQNVPADSRLEWRTVDAMSLPFGDEAFDAVVCQFGLMFFPDKPAALREARRVLKPSGTLLFNTWDSLSDNPIPRIAHETVASFFQTDPPQFYTIPFGLYDRELIERLVLEAGFGAVDCEVVRIGGESESAETAARGLVFGTPLITAIEERGTVPPATIHRAVTERLAEAGGVRPLRLPMQALVFTATRD